VARAFLAYRLVVSKPEERRLRGKHRRRRGDNIKTYLREMGMGSMDWIDLAQDGDRWRVLVNAVMNLTVS
jgi:hypothetical protein